jgi:hypothetical protein
LKSKVSFWLFILSFEWKQICADFVLLFFPAILTKHTTTSHIKALNTEEKKQVLAGDRHKNVPCLNQLKEPQLPPCKRSAKFQKSALKTEKRR